MNNTNAKIKMKLSTFLILLLLIVVSISSVWSSTVTIDGTDMTSDTSSLVVNFEDGWINTDNITLEKLNNVIYIKSGDSSRFADALMLAENNSHVTMYLDDGDYYPGNYMGLPANISSGTTVRGVYPAENTFAQDNLLADGGTRIYCGGNTLFYTENTSGILIENIYVEDFRHIFKCGRRTTNVSGMEYGTSQSVIRNVFGYDGTDYAFELINFQHIRMDMIVVSHCGGLVHAVADTGGNDVFQPGNSFWSDMHIAWIKNDYPIWLEADTASLNYIVFNRLQFGPQMYNGVPQTIGVFLNGTFGNSSAVNACNFYGLDAEGDFDYYIYATYAIQCVIDISGTLNLADDYAVSLDSHSQSNQIKVMKNGKVFSAHYMNLFTGRIADINHPGGSMTGLMWLDDESEQFTMVTGSNDPARRVAYGEYLADFNSKIIESTGYIMTPTTQPTGANEVEGRCYYNAVNHTAYCYNGTTWNALW